MASRLSLQSGLLLLVDGSSHLLLSTQSDAAATITATVSSVARTVGSVADPGIAVAAVTAAASTTISRSEG